MRKSCFVCGKEMDVLHLLVGSHLYCSQDCVEEHRDKDLKKGLFLLLSSASTLNDALFVTRNEEVQEARNLISKAQDTLSIEKTLKHNLKCLRNIGKT
jgi:hypothetical protein